MASHEMKSQNKDIKTIKVRNDSPSERQLAEICKALEVGDVVILPTDTLYGICCDALNIKAVDRICKMKGINPDKVNLSIICSDISMAAEYSKISDREFRLIKANTPGSFTFLLRSSSTLPKVFKGRKTVGIRIPDCAISRAVAKYLGHPLLTTSIQYDDDDYAVNPELIADNYNGRVDLLVAGGEGGTVPSTIVDCTGDIPEIIREGKGVLI